MGLHTFLRHYHINKHSVDVGADLSHPYIIHNPTNTPQGLFIA
ncbi:hypothetical protein HMPREF9144_2817 [Prevotella pallens ATCC 700821]|uniref:Uncharacterized protein n=1 Tax=Prevotella pallens ATCC 700821 TaxID=997353 RepID=F9DMC5_9BACT|nr:hypothetical protein HMPREF9144_2817 [Prevotella pallens ATCC 700821]